MGARRVGIVGAGSVTSLHVPFWQRLGWEVSVHALDGAQALADRYGLEVQPTLEGLLASVDVVDVCTPSASHAEVAAAAVRAGLPVVCEKPMALSFKDALDLAQRGRTSRGDGAAGPRRQVLRPVRGAAPGRRRRRARRPGGPALRARRVAAHRRLVPRRDPVRRASCST